MNVPLKIILAAIIICLCQRSLPAQTIDDSFTFDAPDSVAIGDTFSVRYSLDLKYLERYLSPSFEGFDFIDMDYEIAKGCCTFTYRLKAVTIGLVHIQPMRAVVKGKEVLSQSRDILVCPDDKNRFLADVVNSFLLDNRIAPDTCDVSFIYTSPEYTVVSSRKAHCFAVIANEDYASYLDTPILAYGFENVIESPIPEFLDFLNCYRHQLQYIKSKGFNKHILGDQISPLLKNIEWGQKAPYNSECPMVVSDSVMVRAVAGCGPVAIGQIMKYYGLPGSEDPASLLAYIGSSTETIYGALTTSSHSLSYRDALVDSLGFSPQCRLLTLPQDKLVELTISDLQHGCPVLVMNDSHAFICDGFKDDYLHFNLGWDGIGNGYFKVIKSPLENNKGHLFHSIMYKVVPDHSKGSEKSVKLDRKTRLKDVLTVLEMETIHSLKVTGRLNGADVKLLRRMAGAVDDGDYLSWIGSLQNLDLSQAIFTNDKENPYLQVSAVESKVKIGRDIPVISYGMPFRFERREYDFTFMTEEQWEEIIKYRMHIGDGFRIIKDGNSFIVEYLLTKNKVASNTFTGCINLKNLILPEGTPR